MPKASILMKLRLSFILLIALLNACSSGGSSTQPSTTESNITNEINTTNTTTPEQSSSTPIIKSFTLSPNENNLLMLQANITTQEPTHLSISYKSSNTKSQSITQNTLSDTHSITLMGLRANTTYEVIATLSDDLGNSVTSEPQSFTTSNLPFELPTKELIANTSKSYAGVTLFSITGENARFVGVDEEGYVVWYLADTTLPMLNASPTIRYLGEGRLMLLLKNEVRIVDWMGNKLSSFKLPNYHHDAIILRSGNVMILTNESEVFDGKMLKGDRILEYSPQGSLVWVWSSFEHLDTSRFPTTLSSRSDSDGVYDWSHSNALFEQADGSILLSVRSQSWVVNIDHSSSDINWILGSSEGLTKSSLSDKFFTLTQGSWMSSQHASTVTQNGEYLLYDNRNDTQTNQDSNSRVVRYTIDTTAKQAKQMWEFDVGKYTNALGDVDELSNGNILITAGGGGSHDNAYLIEVSPTSPSALWELHINNSTIYRSERIGWEEFLIPSTQEVNTQGVEIKGEIWGLHANGLVVSSGEENLSLPAGATTFAFSQKIDEGAEYSLRILSQPPNHTCSISNITDSTKVEIHCNDNHINADLTHLPIGDPLILQRSLGDDAPQVGKLWLCRLPQDGAGAVASDDWTNSDGTWNYIIKPQVDGNKSYESIFNIRLDGSTRIITGNALPTTATGIFPVERDTVAFTYDKNPNEISSHIFEIRFDAIPTPNQKPSCVGFGATGISLSGSAIYHGSSTVGTDASAFEMLDKNGGHTDGTQTYHYHYLAQNVLEELDSKELGHSKLMGYIMDGFGIFGPRDDDGKVMNSSQLDECHGHTHEIDWDGTRRTMYHYHWTYDFPYNVGCYKGTPQDSGINHGQ